jgi:hypothetical protein
MACILLMNVPAQHVEYCVFGGMQRVRSHAVVDDPQNINEPQRIRLDEFARQDEACKGISMDCAVAWCVSGVGVGTWELPLGTDRDNPTSRMESNWSRLISRRFGASISRRLLSTCWEHVKRNSISRSRPSSLAAIVLRRALRFTGNMTSEDAHNICSTMKEPFATLEAEQQGEGTAAAHMHARSLVNTRVLL